MLPFSFYAVLQPIHLLLAVSYYFALLIHAVQVVLQGLTLLQSAFLRTPRASPFPPCQVATVEKLRKGAGVPEFLRRTSE